MSQKRKPLPGPLVWVFLFYAFFGIVGVVRMVRAGAGSVSAVSVVCLVVAFGTWHRKVWARWLGILLSSLLVLIVVLNLAKGGTINGATLGETLVHAWLACVLLWKWPRR